MPSTSPAHFPPLNQMLKDRSFSLFGHRRSCLTRLPPSGQAHCRAELVSALSLCCTGRTLSVVSICLWISPKAPSPLPVLPLMKRNGRVFITQRGPEKKRSEIRVQSSCNRTFQKRSSPLMAFLKPLQGAPFCAAKMNSCMSVLIRLKYITTIDFGQLVTEVESASPVARAEPRGEQSFQADLERLISSAGCFEVLEPQTQTQPELQRSQNAPTSDIQEQAHPRLRLDPPPDCQACYTEGPRPPHRCNISDWRALFCLAGGVLTDQWLSGRKLVLCPSGGDGAETNRGHGALKAPMAQE